jgi:hypothetical protein
VSPLVGPASPDELPEHEGSTVTVTEAAAWADALANSPAVPELSLATTPYVVVMEGQTSAVAALPGRS